MRNSHYSHKTSKFWQHSLWIRLTLRNYHQHRRIHQLLRTLPTWYQLTRGVHHWKGDTLPKLVACGLSNIRSNGKKNMSSSSRHNSKNTLLWISRTSLTILICVSMQWIDSENTSFLTTSPSKETHILKNTLSHIANTIPTPGIYRYTLPLDTHS